MLTERQQFYCNWYFPCFYFRPLISASTLFTVKPVNGFRGYLIKKKIKCVLCPRSKGPIKSSANPMIKNYSQSIVANTATILKAAQSSVLSTGKAELSRSSQRQIWVLSQHANPASFCCSCNSADAHIHVPTSPMPSQHRDNGMKPPTSRSDTTWWLREPLKKERRVFWFVRHALRKQREFPTYNKTVKEKERSPSPTNTHTLLEMLCKAQQSLRILDLCKSSF